MRTRLHVVLNWVGGPPVHLDHVPWLRFEARERTGRQFDTAMHRALVRIERRERYKDVQHAAFTVEEQQTDGEASSRSM